MNISEIFFSVQGEGKFVGVPSIFIRTSSCNLRCQWCDTPYTSWKPEKNLMSIEKIVSVLENYNQVSHVVITGGEPFLQKDLGILIRSIRSLDKIITVETNGTIFKPIEVDLLSVSPKLSNSTPKGKWKTLHEEKRISIDVLEKLIQHQERNGLDYQFKFVVENLKDLDEVQQIIKKLEANRKIPNERIFLMPQAQTRDELRKGYEKVVELAKKTGYRLSTRLHVEIWGNKRSV